MVAMFRLASPLAIHLDKVGEYLNIPFNYSDGLRLCALFIRDVRDIRGYLSLIQQNETLSIKNSAAEYCRKA